MKRNQNYLTPEISEYEISTEGVLCVSDPIGQPGADAGVFDENEW